MEKMTKQELEKKFGDSSLSFLVGGNYGEKRICCIGKINVED